MRRGEGGEPSKSREGGVMGTKEEQREDHSCESCVGPVCDLWHHHPKRLHRKYSDTPQGALAAVPESSDLSKAQSSDNHVAKLGSLLVVFL